jgi:hypothetical protein
MSISTRESGIHRSSVVLLDKTALFYLGLSRFTFNQPEEPDVTIFHPILV